MIIPTSISGGIWEGLDMSEMNVMFYDSTTVKIKYNYQGNVIQINLNITKNAEGFEITGEQTVISGSSPTI